MTTTTKAPKGEALKRVFLYNGQKLADPSVTMEPDQVREIYANQFPELANAVVEGPEHKGNVLEYTFHRAVGTKGAQ